ncbi:LOW QUALITY PROTEIN: hypothetical protein CRUP_023793, partial [Coryphaenoides rupestris]
EAHDKDIQVVELPIVDSLHPRPPYLPLAIPEDLALRLHRLHGDPSVWWVSQFVKYLVRLAGEGDPADHGEAGLQAPHHRFQLLARRMHVDKKRVYLATDDPSLLQEAKTKYPDYHFISDNSISWSAGLHNRYTENSLRGVILDIHFLSQTDFLVCTFSSQNAHNQVAVHAHQPRGSEDIPLEPGDLVGVAGNHWDGYSKGVNRKLGRTGLYPSYKVREKVETVKYPTYPEADKLLGVPPQQQNNNNNNNNINNNININDDNDNKGVKEN